MLRVHVMLIVDCSCFSILTIRDYRSVAASCDGTTYQEMSLQGDVVGCQTMTSLGRTDVDDVTRQTLRNVTLETGRQEGSMWHVT